MTSVAPKRLVETLTFGAVTVNAARPSPGDLIALVREQDRLRAQAAALRSAMAGGRISHEAEAIDDEVASITAFLRTITTGYARDQALRSRLAHSPSRIQADLTDSMASKGYGDLNRAALGELLHPGDIWSFVRSRSVGQRPDLLEALAEAMLAPGPRVVGDLRDWLDALQGTLPRGYAPT